MKLILENWNNFVNEEEAESVTEQSSEKPKLNFYEHPNGFKFRGDVVVTKVSIDDIVARLREGGLKAGGKDITGDPRMGQVIDMGVVRGGSPEDYENLMRQIAERLKDNFSLTFNYSRGPEAVRKTIG
tara:strand:- start:45 stop:428 length:384 start_codon:yes stop_codon:yes gene_type:complete